MFYLLHQEADLHGLYQQGLWFSGFQLGPGHGECDGTVLSGLSYSVSWSPLLMGGWLCHISLMRPQLPTAVRNLPYRDLFVF